MRSLLTLSTGAALGASAMYLFDPDQGPARRRDARRSALREARRGAVNAVKQAARRAEDVASAAVSGYAEARGADRTP